MHRSLNLGQLLIGLVFLAIMTTIILLVTFFPKISNALTTSTDKVSNLVISQYTTDFTTFFAVIPEHPNQQRQLHVVKHAPGWDIVGSLSPDGNHLAYLVLQQGTHNPRSEASLIILEGLNLADGPRSRHLFDGADLYGKLSWSADGKSLFVRSTDIDTHGRSNFKLFEINITDGSNRILIQRNDILGLYPVGRTIEGITYAVIITPKGSELLSIHTSTNTTEVETVLLSPVITRSWSLSADGKKLAFTAQYGITLQVLIADLETNNNYPNGNITLSRTFSEANQLNETASPVWHPNGSLSVGVLKTIPINSTTATVQKQGNATTIELDSNSGFHLPITWSPNGENLAARAFTGTGPRSPGEETIVVIDNSGKSQTIPGEFIQIIGWSDELY